MATGWHVYAAAKRGLMAGALDLDAGGFVMSLHGAASNAADLTTLSALSEVTEPLAAATMITSWGPAPGDPTQMQFAATPTEFAGPVQGIMYAVVAQDGVLLCMDQLSAAAFDILAGKSLTVTMNAQTGVFTLG